MENEGAPPRTCNHNVPDALKTSMTVRNPARRFYCCRRREFDDCGLWEWLDPELSPYYKLAFYRMKLESDRTVERLNAQMLMENMHNERLRMKVIECEALQRKLEKARASIGELELEMKKKEWKLRWMQFGCVFAAFIVAFMSMM